MRKLMIGLAASVAVLGAAATAGAAPATTSSTATSSAATPPGKTSAATRSGVTSAAPTTHANATGPSGSFSTEAAAKAHCPSDTVLWGNPGSKVLHYPGSSDYGKTKRGGYMCESEATKTGYHVAKGEKHS